MVAIKLLAVLMLALLSACTYSVSMQHSVGSTDTVEETTTPTVSPNITAPLAGARGLEGQEPRPRGPNGPAQSMEWQDWS